MTLPRPDKDPACSSGRPAPQVRRYLSRDKRSRQHPEPKNIGIFRRQRAFQAVARLISIADIGGWRTYTSLLLSHPGGTSINQSNPTKPRDGNIGSNINLNKLFFCLKTFNQSSFGSLQRRLSMPFPARSGGLGLRGWVDQNTKTQHGHHSNMPGHVESEGQLH